MLKGRGIINKGKLKNFKLILEIKKKKLLMLVNKVFMSRRYILYKKFNIYNYK